ncbi:interferon-inducible GTPase 5-like [Xenia sp. Carnegie-2017]|uniref:interferon-inducible GTPase 5-like n=1 Tax=Xenia sp. Carnegie-2017 TaxID=2897299 RepID=UPI001F03B0DE|nr:interferon-inducible GTPase 5-like [Xenia sp. Carnegie-2017]
MDDNSWEHVFMEDVKGYVEEHGVSGIEDFFKTKLGRWKDVEVNIGVTGNSGVGKSSFINAIRGLREDDEGAAETGVTETTMMATSYPHPTNPKIFFWDLPGIGTPNYPDLPTYCEKVNLEKYDTFLIFTMKRFTQNDLILAKKVKDLNKSFFFIRTHIDVDYNSEKRRKAFDEAKMLEKIRTNCWENFQNFDHGLNENEVFLISNHYPTRWDFAHLTQSILDVLPFRQRECLTLSLGVLTSLSTDILKRKADVLRGRIWMIATASAVGALVPLPGLSIAVDVTLITTEMNFYKSQLGLPDENSQEFNMLTPAQQNLVRQLCTTSAAQLAKIMATYATSSTVEEMVRFVPIIGSVIAGGISFTSTYLFLQSCVSQSEKAALEFLHQANIKSVDDLDID